MTSIHPPMWLMTIIAASLATALSAPRATAQTDDELARARAAFEAANTAADEDRFADARALFEESLRLAPRAATALNLAQVLRSLGALTESEHLVVALLAGEYGEATATVRERAETLRASLAGSFARLTITLSGAELARLEVDDELRDPLRAEVPTSLRLDPGTHHLRAQSDDGRVIERDIALAAGRSEAITLTMPRATTVASTPLVVEEPPAAGEDLTWVGFLVGGVVLVGAGVGIAIGVATAPPAIDTVRDPVWGEAVALTIGF